MAIEVAAGYVSIVPATKGFAAQLDRDVQTAAKNAGDKGGRSFAAGMSSHIKGIAATLGGAFAVSKGIQFLSDATAEASNLNESLNAVRVTFGKNSAAVTKLGTEAARSLGLSQNEFNSLAVRFSNFAGTVAGKGGDVVGTLDDLTTRASDFASVMNLEVADAAELFQSGLAGETEPLRKYGIDMSAAKVEAYALANGIAKNAGEMTEAQKVQARYALLMEQTSKTAGDFANTSDSLANRQRIARAEMANARAEIGNALLPVMEGLTRIVQEQVVPAVRSLGQWMTNVGLPRLQQFGRWIQNNRDWLLKLAIAVGAAWAAWKVYSGVTAAIDFAKTAIQIGLQTAAWLRNTAAMAANKLAWMASQAAAVGGFIAAAITTIGAQTLAWTANTSAIIANRIATVAANAAMLVVRGAIMAWTAAQWALNLALNANPIGLVVMAIAALVAAVVLLWNKNEGFRNFILAAWEAIKIAAETVWNGIKTVIEVVWTAIEWYVRTYVGAVRTVIETAWNLIKTTTLTVWNAIKAAVEAVWSGIEWAVSHYVGLVKMVLTTAWDLIKTGAQIAWDTIKDVIVTPIRNAWNRLTEIVDNVRTGLGGAWTEIQTTASNAWHSIKNAITSPLSGLWGDFKEFLGVNEQGDIVKGKGALGGLWNAFDKVVGVVGSSFSGITDEIKKPISAAFAWVNEKVITELNDKILSKFGDLRIPPLPTFATGGWVSGPGTGTSDSILARLSDGEFVVNARAATRNRQLLEHINSGLPVTGAQVQRGAGGGWVNPAGWVKNLLAKGAGAAIRALTGPALDWIRSDEFGINKTIGGQFVTGGLETLFASFGKWGDKQIPLVSQIGEALFAYMKSIEGHTGYYQECLATIHAALDSLQQRFGFTTGSMISSYPDPNHIIDALGAGAFHKTPAPRGALAFWRFPGASGHIAVATGIDSQSINNWGGDSIETVANLGSSGYVGWLPPERFINKYDSGGFLPTGWSAVFNGTGRPEPVLTSQQWATLTTTDRGPSTEHHWTVYATEAPVEETILTSWRRMEALAGV